MVRLVIASSTLCILGLVVLKAELERYATMHSQAYREAVDAATLIPHML